MSKRGRRKEKFWREMLNELHEHRSSFIAFSILRLLTIIVLIRQIMIGNYESAFFCLLTVLLLYIPSWLQVQLHFELPPALEITVLCLIFSAAVLGEVNAFYVVVPGWDTMMHTVNGFLAAAVGFSLVTFLNGHKKILFDLSPFFLALVSFCFSMTIGILWEFFEFGMDRFFGMDMQKDTIVHAINTVKLDETLTNTVVSLKNINEVVVNGRELGLGGYLDIGLTDTMKDLFVNFLGALVFCVIGYFCMRGRKFWIGFLKNFIPRRREAREE